MKVAFDTSVLVAAMLATHRDHARAVLWWCLQILRRSGSESAANAGASTPPHAVRA